MSPAILSKGKPMHETLKVHTLEEILSASAARESFKAAIRELEAGRKTDPIRFNAGAPPVKVLRMLMKLLETHPEHPFESIEVQAASGCSDFKGSAKAEPGDIAVAFNWDCAWRARQQEWADHWGDPDQIRAAQTFGYQCFENFEVVKRTAD